MSQWIVVVQGGTPSELEAKALECEDGATSWNVRLRNEHVLSVGALPHWEERVNRQKGD